MLKTHTNFSSPSNSPINQSICKLIVLNHRPLSQLQSIQNQVSVPVCNLHFFFWWNFDSFSTVEQCSILVLELCFQKQEGKKNKWYKADRDKDSVKTETKQPREICIDISCNQYRLVIWTFLSKNKLLFLPCCSLHFQFHFILMAHKLIRVCVWVSAYKLTGSCF